MHVDRKTFERKSSVVYHHVVWKWEQNMKTEKSVCLSAVIRRSEINKYYYKVNSHVSRVTYSLNQ